MNLFVGKKIEVVQTRLSKKGQLEGARKQFHELTKNFSLEEKKEALKSFVKLGAVQQNFIG